MVQLDQVRCISQFFRENFTTNVIQATSLVLGGFLCLIPLYYHPLSILEESLLRDSLTSNGYRYSSVATFALVIPVLCDITMDLVFKSNIAKASVKEGFLNNIEKLLFLSGIVILPVVAFLPKTTTNWAFIYLCCKGCHQIMIFGSVCISLNRYDKKCWTDRATYVIIITLVAGNVIYCNINDLEMKLDIQITNFYESLSNTAHALLITAAVIYILCAFRYVGRNLCPYVFNKAKLKSELYFPLVYITMTALFLVLTLFTKLVYNDIKNYDAVALLLNNLINFAYVLFITLLSMRMVKSEVVQGLVSNIIYE